MKQTSYPFDSINTPADSVVSVHLISLTTEQAKSVARKSARSKLAKLGLTDEEVAPIIGGL